MPLATKNGSLIIKSGSIAENCNCCAGGWYCYVESCPDSCSPCCTYGTGPTRLTVLISTTVTGVICRQTTSDTTAGPYPDYTATRAVTLVKNSSSSGSCYTWTFSEDFEAAWYAAGQPFRTDPLSTYVTVAVAKNCSGYACALQWSVTQAVLLNGYGSGRVVLNNGSTCGTTPFSDITGGRVLSTQLDIQNGQECFASLPYVESAYSIISTGALWNASSVLHSITFTGSDF